MLRSRRGRRLLFLHAMAVTTVAAIAPAQTYRPVAYFWLPRYWALYVYLQSMNYSLLALVLGITSLRVEYIATVPIPNTLCRSRLLHHRTVPRNILKALGVL